VCYVKQVITNDGWSSAFQACKGDGSRRMLDEDKKGSSKEKKTYMWFLVGICSRSCRIKGLQK
jgi:hypothetical protein